jgi:hypothetical protein
MGINGWLILNIAIGVIVANLLMPAIQRIFKRLSRKVVTEAVPQANLEEPSADDWLELWESVPEGAKQQTQTFVDDDQLRRRAQELNLWTYLWSAAPEETKEKLRSRWKVAKIPPRISG